MHKKNGVNLQKRCFSLRAFTLAELMVAIAFISIALFGYISLHLRIIHSSLRLEQHEEIRNILETALLRQLATSRVQDVAEGETPQENVAGADLTYKMVKRVSRPDSSSHLKRLEADLIWHDGFGDHGFHVESYARKYQWGW